MVVAMGVVDGVTCLEMKDQVNTVCAKVLQKDEVYEQTWTLGASTVLIFWP